MGIILSASRKLTLTDGTSLTFVNAEWRRIGSGNRSGVGMGDGGRMEYKRERLTVWRHPDGRALIEGAVKIEQSAVREINEMVPSTGDVRGSIRHVAVSLSLSQHVLDCCVEGVDRAESLENCRLS